MKSDPDFCVRPLLSRLGFAAASVITAMLSAAQPWQEITMPTLAEAAAAWTQPPAEYRAIHWAIWGGPQSKDRILADIERIAVNGGGVYMINNSRGLQPTYFSTEYLDLVKFTVAECKRHGLKVWIEDEAGYPDGMAGGLISRDYPQLGMQGIVADVRYTVAAGQTLNIPLPPDTLGVLAYNRATRTSTVVPLPASGPFRFIAPNPGLSEIVFVRHVFRSSPTRYTNRADGTSDKDSLYSLIDYLDPEATRTYIRLIYETYETIVGEEFGKTILGFRGDEPDYTGFMPWTPKLLETFRREKGYDLQPFLAQFFGVELSPEAVRAKADYWDVWSALFRENFFKPQVDWCRARGMEYMVHLNHEETMLDLARGEDLIRNEGSFFRAMRYVDVPGVDNLAQIAPGIIADFPKLAADAAHVFGHPHVWTEAGGGLGQTGKFVADYQLVRGINFLNIRGLNGGPGTAAPPLHDPAAATAWYVNRAGYLLSVGRPGAQVALFHPTDSMWLGDQESDAVTVRLTTQLLEHQIDFDAIDTDALTSICTLENGGLKNLSGQIYRALIVPACTALHAKMLERLRAFARAGGKVIFVGRTPSLVYDATFLRADSHAPDLSFATLLEPAAEITARVLSALPAEVKLDTPCPSLKYIRRTLRDAEVYFFFNESDQVQSNSATLTGHGDVQVWDATTGAIHPVAGVPKAQGSVAVPLTLAPHESRFVVIGPLPSGAMGPLPTQAKAEIIAELNGAWSVTIGEKKTSTGLVPWQELGVDSFNGIAEYRKTFDAQTTLATGKPVYLDLGDVREVARVRLNDHDLPPRGWPPYLWEVTSALQKGANTLVVEVQVPLLGGRGFGGFGAGRGGRGGPGGTNAAGAVTPRAIAPTGVPGGLATDAMIASGSRAGGGRGAVGMGMGTDANGNPAALSGPGVGARVASPAGTSAASGLLGPVRLLAP